MMSADDQMRARTLRDELAPLPPVIVRTRSNRSAVPAAIVAFVLGAGIVGLLAWHGGLAAVLPRSAQPAASATVALRGPAETSALETRLALLEDRFSRLDQQANAAAGNAARAEGLLVAQATRRAIERGQPLGPLADQLRLHFADAQPRAVETLIAFAQRPVTQSALDARLDTLAPQLGSQPGESTSWRRVRSALSGLFTIRSDAEPTLRPQDRIGRAKLLLADGQIDAASEAITRLPGAAAASQWTEEARRFGAAQQALDVIEAAALTGPARDVATSTVPIQ